jgi:hypothetical protein
MALDRYKRYAAEHGSPNVPRRYTEPDGYNLGLICMSWRASLRRGDMPPARVEALAAAGFPALAVETQVERAIQGLHDARAAGSANWRSRAEENAAVRSMRIRFERLSRAHQSKLRAAGLDWLDARDGWFADHMDEAATYRAAGNPWPPSQLTNLGMWLARVVRLWTAGQLPPDRGRQIEQRLGVDVETWHRGPGPIVAASPRSSAPQGIPTIEVLG